MSFRVPNVAPYLNRHPRQADERERLTAGTIRARINQPRRGSPYDLLVIASTYLTIVLLGQGIAAPRVQPGEWRLKGAPNEFTMEASGSATDPKGAVIALRSTSNTPRTSGSAMASLPANEFRGRRVTLSAELLVGSGKGAGLLIRADSDTTVALTLENSMADLVRVDDGWKLRSVSIPVPDDATVVEFGLLLQGAGSVSARGVRLSTSKPLAGLPISEPAKGVVDEAMSLAKTNALHRDKVDWEKVEQKVRALSAGAKNPSEAYAAIQWLLTQLDDRRSYIVPAARVKEFWAGTSQTSLPVVRTDDRVGYVSMPGYNGGDPDAMRAYAKGVESRLESIASHASCGFVVDLRETSGHHAWPMLSGLSLLLGGGLSSDTMGVTPTPSFKDLVAARVAVLIGPRTWGSGEALALALRGRSPSRTFGQPTAGLQSPVPGFPLSDGAMMLLTTAPSADRTGGPHYGRVEPDELVAEGDLSAALRWLRQSPSCGK